MASVDSSTEASTATSKSSFIFKEKDWDSPFRAKLRKFRVCEAHVDLVIVAENHEIPCHRVVLAAASDYFEELFKPGRPESTSGRINFNDVDTELIVAIMEFMYTGTIEVSFHNAQAVVKAAERLGLYDLKTATDEFMAELVDPGNCIGNFVFSKEYNLKRTQEASKEALMKRFPDILRLSLDLEFHTLPVACLEGILSSDDLEVEDEGSVFNFLLKWIGADPKTREPMFDQLLPLVRLPLCTPEFLFDTVEQCPLLSTEASFKLVLEAKNYHLLPKYREVITGPRTKPRKGHKPRTKSQLMLVGGESPKGYSPVCWRLKEDNSGWEEFAQLPGEAQAWLQACVIGNTLIVSGGRIDTPFQWKGTATCWQLNLEDGKWRALPSMAEARRTHSMVCIGDVIYVTGGYNNGKLKSVERLDATRQAWTTIAPMPNARDEHSGIAYQDCIYVLGGDVGGNDHKTIHMYSPATNTWVPKASMPKECRRGVAVVHNDLFYMVGGNTSVCQSYNPKQDLWTTLAVPSVQNLWPGAAVVWKDKVLLCGGGPSDTIEEYDPSTDKWQVSTLTLPQPLQGHWMVNREYTDK